MFKEPVVRQCPDVFIVAAHRTPVGAYRGQLSAFSAPMLGAAAVRLCLAELDLNGNQISQVIVGQGTAGIEGTNVANRTAELARIGPGVPTETVKLNSIAGLAAVLHAYNAIRFGRAKLVVCGGQESLTKIYNGAVKPYETQIRRANNLAEKYNISRSTMDKYTSMSCRKARKAMQKNTFKQEIVALPGCSRDENVANGMNTTLKELKTKPTLLFDGANNPTITYGNSATNSDGAAALILCNAAEIPFLRKDPLAKVMAGVKIELAPNSWGVGLATAIQATLEITRWSINDVHLFELQEVFAVHPLIVIDKLQIDPLKVNVSGGALAFGHPVAASSANMLVTLVHNLRRLGLKKGIAAACNGKDWAIAIAVEAE